MIDPVKLWKGSSLSDTKTLKPPHQTLVVFRAFTITKRSQKSLKGNKSNPELKNVYTHCQHKFDKTVRQAKRQFVHKQQWSLACSLKSNPKQFWKWFDGITLRGQTHTLKLPNSVNRFQRSRAIWRRKGSVLLERVFLYPSYTQITDPRFTLNSPSCSSNQLWIT